MITLKSDDAKLAFVVYRPFGRILVSYTFKYICTFVLAKLFRVVLLGSKQVQIDYNL